MNCRRSCVVKHDSVVRAALAAHYAFRTQKAVCMHPDLVRHAVRYSASSTIKPYS